VILESYSGGGSITYTYDQGTYGKGRLTSVQDAATTTNSTYEAHGRVTQKTQIVGAVSHTVGYHYDAHGRLDQQTYPSGMIVVFGYTNGQVTSINAAGQAVLAGALYSPFGAVKSWTWGNGQAYARGVDLDGRVTSYPGNTSYQTLAFDNASRIISITDSNNATLNQGFGYDVLDRLTSDTQGSGGTQPVRGYTYDPTGNRLTSTVAGVVTNYTTPTTTNRLASASGGQVATLHL
jgi:YD repeat-containing protein